MAPAPGDLCLHWVPNRDGVVDCPFGTCKMTASYSLRRRGVKGAISEFEKFRSTPIHLPLDLHHPYVVNKQSGVVPSELYTLSDRVGVFVSSANGRHMSDTRQ
jgi:hypothetical protein